MSEINAVTLPKMGMSMQEGRVVEWLVNEGDALKIGDEIAEVESEKIVNALEAAVEGVVRRKVVLDDAFYPVGKLLAVVADASISDAEIDAFIADHESAFAKELETRPRDTGPTSVELNGRRIAYAMTGEGDEATVFIHGLGGQKEAWMLIQNSVAELGRTVAIDLPGHGGSTKTVDSGELDELAAYVLGVMDELDIKAAHIVGHSLGGVIAAHIGKENPDRTKSLFLISSAGPGTVVDPQFIQDFGNAGSRKEVKNVLSPLFVNRKLLSRDVIQAVLKAKRIEGANDCLKTIGEVSGTALASLNPTGILAAIPVPVSIVWGKDDVICSLDNTEGLPESVKLTVLDEVGHMPQLEAMERVNDLILAHIKAIS